MGIKVPEGYTSKDVIDRRDGQKQTLGDKARDVAIAVRNDYEESKRISAAKRSQKPSTKTPQVAAGVYPSYKKGGRVRKTGLALLHKGEKVIPKKNVKRVEKAVRKYKR